MVDINLYRISLLAWTVLRRNASHPQICNQKLCLQIHYDAIPFNTMNQMQDACKVVDVLLSKNFLSKLSFRVQWHWMSDRIRSFLSLPNVFTVLYTGYTMTNMRFKYCCVPLLMLCLCDCCDIFLCCVWICCFEQCICICAVPCCDICDCPPHCLTATAK